MRLYLVVEMHICRHQVWEFSLGARILLLRLGIGLWGCDLGVVSGIMVLRLIFWILSLGLGLADGIWLLHFSIWGLGQAKAGKGRERDRMVKGCRQMV